MEKFSRLVYTVVDTFALIRNISLIYIMSLYDIRWYHLCVLVLLGPLYRLWFVCTTGQECRYVTKVIKACSRKITAINKQFQRLEQLKRLHLKKIEKLHLKKIEKLHLEELEKLEILRKVDDWVYS